MSFLTDALDEALKKFGTYSYEDKGPDEIMDVNALVRELCELIPPEVKHQLDALRAHEHGELLYETLWSRLIEDEAYPMVDELDELLDDPHEGGPEPFEVEALTVNQMLERTVSVTTGTRKKQP